jgi:alkylated DNA nucleotide flippase Atl1
MLYVESFFVRRLLIGRATANINRILLSIVTEMDAQLPVDHAVRAYLSAGRKYYASDTLVRDAVRQMPYYLNGRPHQRKLVLQWLEESYGSKEPVATETLTIEHVLPQTPTAQWEDEFRRDLDPEEDFTEAYEAVVHTLGNLTLTGYNPELGNSPFDVKRARLRRSGICLSRDIAAQDRWGRPEIRTRADALAERAIAIWPGSVQTGSRAESDVAWDVMNRALAELPAGSWTTYGDLAALIGTAPQAVGNRLATHPAPNPHRVLQVEGTISPGFRWPDGRTDDPRDLLRAEGVVFDRLDRADPAQRIYTEELAQLIGMTPDDLPGPHSTTTGTLPESFVEQLTAAQGDEVANATLLVRDAWIQLGGTVLYGTGAQTSCFLMARGKDHELGNIWPAAIYPSGKFEIVFQHLSSRPPFDEVSLRDEFRQRLNEIHGVTIAGARIGLRPGFPLTVLVDSHARDVLLQHLGWFYERAQKP